MNAASGLFTHPELTTLAGFLRFRMLDSGKRVQAALFIVNVMGEPIGFAYNQVHIEYPFLWRKKDLLKKAQTTLLKTLLDSCPAKPDVLLCLKDEFIADPSRFSKGIPIILVTPDDPPLENDDDWLQDAGFEWLHSVTEESPAHQLCGELSRRRLLVEPFFRALKGLIETYDPEE